MILLVVCASLFFTSFFGYLVHRLLHVTWAGPLYRAHMNHHLIEYPPYRLVTSSYRRTKWYNSGTFLFTPPLVCLLVLIGGLLTWAGVALWVTAVFAVIMISFAVSNDVIHDSFHIENCRLQRFGWWRRKQAQHFIHHRNMKRNYGIISFEFDRSFKTFKDSQ